MKAAYVELLQNASISKNENQGWLRSLKNINKEAFSKQLVEVHEEVFAQTNCLECANCCKTTPPILTNEDVNRIAKFLKISSKQFVKEYVLEDYYGEKTLISVPCQFLQADNSCMIYEIRPEACRRFPHTNEKDYPKRTSLNLANTMICPAAYKILELLKLSFPTS